MGKEKRFIAITSRNYVRKFGEFTKGENKLFCTAGEDKDNNKYLQFYQQIREILQKTVWCISGRYTTEQN